MPSEETVKMEFYRFGTWNIAHLATTLREIPHLRAKGARYESPGQARSEASASPRVWSHRGIWGL